jgi:hypothetical protein
MALEKVRRFDVSHSLVHLTRHRARGPLNMTTEASAYEVLKEILQTGKIEAGSGFVKGGHRAACFSEIPLSALHGFAAQPTVDILHPRYEFYGIAISKSSGFRLGARPVIYLPDAEAGWIPPDQQWRHVRFEHGQVDWTHEREWRSPNNVDLTQIGFYVIVWSADEASEVTKLDIPLKNNVLGVLPMEHLNEML